MSDCIYTDAYSLSRSGAEKSFALGDFWKLPGWWMTYFQVLLFFQDVSHVKFLTLGQKVSKSLTRKKPTQSIKGEPSFPILKVYALQFSWPQGKTKANQGNMSGNTTIIGYSTAIDCSQSPIFPYDRQDH